MSSSPSIRRTSSTHTTSSTKSQPTQHPTPMTNNSNQFSNTSNTLGNLPRKAGFGRVGLGDHPTSSSTQPTTYFLDKRKKSLTNLSSPNGHSTTRPNTNPSSHLPPTRRLGSFNSLAAVTPTTTTQSKDWVRSSSGGIVSDEKNSKGDHHPLRFQWVFWVLHRSPSKKMSEEEFGKSMRRLGSCNSVETFYPLYLHMKRPSSQTPIADIHLFSNPIKPVWEDPSNVKGGKWTIRLRKGLSDRLWENLVLSLIGGGLEKLICEEGDSQDEICGAVLSVRRDEDILSVWHRNGDPELAGDGKIAKKVKLAVQTVLQLPLNCNLVYKLNADSLANGTHQAQKQQQQQTNHDQAHHLKPHHHRIQPNRPTITRKRESGTGTGGGGEN